MRISPLLLIVCLSLSVMLEAQPPVQKEVHDAWLISRMVEKYHVQPRALDDTMSAAIYSRLLEELDPQKFFLTGEDIARLQVYRFRIDDEIRNSQADFLQLLTGIYKQRLMQADTMIDHIVAAPFQFTINERLTAGEQSAYPATGREMHTKMYKLLKLSVLRSIIRYYGQRELAPSQKITDSLEPILRKKAGSRAKRNIKRMLQSPQGFESMIGIAYCQVLASTYDPHTDYFPPEMKTAFESELGNKPLAFGFSLNEDEDGNPQIAHLIPGSPAFQSGGLNEGDKIVSIQWDTKDAIDVTGASLAELNGMLSAEGGLKAILTVIKSDGTRRQVSLFKARLNVDEDEDKVKGFILKGARTIGYISLPAFYSDWEDSKGVNGCANDVAREIIKLKKENMDGLILDLRYNGGGSMEEAVELSGIFIDAGPVEQIKDRDNKIYTLKDVNRGTIFDGPLLLLVNGFSASASEMVAGTLQDYNRALIVGSPTYGKATAQVVVPIDTTIDPEKYDGHKEGSSYIKITTSKLYRINGTSAQVIGVKPDILLPEPPDAAGEREANEKFALPSSTIDANKYYKPLPPLPIQSLVQAAKSMIDSSDFFKAAINNNSQIKNDDLSRDYSLLLKDALLENIKESGTASGERREATASVEKPAAFKVTNLIYEQQRIQADHNVQTMNEERKTSLSEDPYVSIAYQLLTVLLK